MSLAAHNVSRPSSDVPSGEEVKRKQHKKAKKGSDLRKLEMRRQRRQRRLLRAAARLATSASVDETPLLDCEGTAASASQTTSSTIHPTTHSVAPDSSLLDPTNGTQPAPSATSLDDASFDMPDLELQVSHTEGDVISLATKNGVLVHACNCLGAWGSGIALQLKRDFPAAYRVYAHHCATNYPEDLLGTCLLIQPQLADYNNTTVSSYAAKTRSGGNVIHGDDNERVRKSVWIACLFTSVGWGRGNKRSGNPGVSSKADIVKATSAALMSFLLEWLDARDHAEELVIQTPPSEEQRSTHNDMEQEGKKADKDEQESAGTAQRPGDIFSPRFNAGSFGVPWEATEELILQKWGGVETEWTVVSNSK